MKGFTLLETLFAVAILALLAAIIMSGFSSFQESGELLRTTDLAAGVLRDARGRTLASRNSREYGVHFGTDIITLFEGAAYNPAVASNIPVLLPFRVEISSIALTGGLDETVFRRLSGEAAATGTITFRVKRKISKTKDIRIYESGVVEIK